MKASKKNSLVRKFENFATAVTRAAGHPQAFILAFLIVLIWGITGPVFHFSDTWQLVINTGTTIVTFLMVFLIQLSQNKDSEAIQLKLNEIVAAMKGASNRLINIEDLSEEELQKLHKYYHKLSELAKKETDLAKSHSIEEAELKHQAKQKHPKDSLT
jgi:low affinity Fe/Cu permease